MKKSIQDSIPNNLFKPFQSFQSFKTFVDNPIPSVRISANRKRGGNFMTTNSHRKSNGYNRGGARRIIDADGHVRETDEQIMEYMSAGYRSRRDAMLYFPLVPHHGWHRSIPANDFRYQDFRVPDWREWGGKLDEGNIELTVLYPTRFMHIGQIGNRATPLSCAAPITIFSTS